MIHVALGAIAPMNEPTTKSETPIRTMRFLPVRSASAPAGIKVAALTIVNAFAIHDKVAGDVPGKALRSSGNTTEMLDRPIPVKLTAATVIAITMPGRIEARRLLVNAGIRGTLGLRVAYDRTMSGSRPVGIEAALTGAGSTRDNPHVPRSREEMHAHV